MESIPETYRFHGGGRVASDRHRQAMARSEDFAGLEEGVDRYDLLLLVKRTARLIGVSPRALQLLEYYLAYTRDGDWEEGAFGPVVYQSLARTALDLGVSDRQIQNLEATLFRAGLIGYRDSGNHQRYGQRCPQTGRILYAFGIDLSPMAYKREELEAKLAEKQLYDEAWLATKRSISQERRAIRALLAEWMEQGAASDLSPYEFRYDEIAIQIRTHLDLAALRSLLERHKALHSELVTAMGVKEPQLEQGTQQSNLSGSDDIPSPGNEKNFVPNKYITHEINKLNCSLQDAGFQKSVVEPSETFAPAITAGLHHVTLAMAIGATSRRFEMLLPTEPSWPDLVEAAFRLRPELGISQASWGQACEVLGRNGAALCLLVTDRATEREENAVRQPPAYFRAMINRARGGELRLHSSVFGLLALNKSSAKL